MNGQVDDPPLIHTAIERHAARTPDAIALVDGQERVGYAELDAAANAYADALRDRGVGPGCFVPVILPRSSTLVTALLAILKCGAAYAVLDPAWPNRRITSLIDVLNPPVTIAETPHGHPSALWRPSVKPPSGSAQRPPDQVAYTLNGSAPAAVFFTSGTGGRPKAVVSSHRAGTRLFRGKFAPFQVGPVMPQAAPVSWDGFTLEAWGPLLTGGTSVLVRDGYLLPDTLRALIARDGVDTVWLTASLFHLFVDESPGCFTGLRQVLTGGERLSVARVRDFLTLHPDIELINGYGPAESCVFATAHRVKRRDCDLPSGIPLGRPVPGTGVRVMSGPRPTATGTVGEICVVGDGLALAYLGDPELTARKFPTVTLDGKPVRMYLTGDQGFMDQDGLLHFVGRLDRQVKIRGHRVEPEEVEDAARRVSGVRECAVVPVAGEDGGHERLALFYTSPDSDAGGPRDVTPRALRRALKSTLPRHLVPELVLRRTRLPVTAHGKLDRASLLAELDRTHIPKGDQ